MQRVKRSSAVASLPAAPGGGTPGYFALPNPGGGVPATVPGYEWFNSVQEEICSVIAAAGLTLDVANTGQLLAALPGALAASSAMGRSLATSGYQKLPGGLIIQWGVTPLINANGQLAVALPVAFPTANLCAVSMAEYSTAPDAAYMVSIFGRTVTNMSFYNANTTTQIKATYIALGH